MSQSQTLAGAPPSGVEEGDDRNSDHYMPYAQNPSEASDSGSGSSSDSDSEDEAQAKAQIEAIEAVLNSNPSDYVSHVQVVVRTLVAGRFCGIYGGHSSHTKYIKILRKQGDIEKLRQARETMGSLFPLSPEMWREWAKDEITMSSGVEAFSTVEKIYERGVSDYLSVSLWCDYLNFVQEHDPSVRECSASGISKARNLFERALTSAGLHVAEGHMLWELYREFEQAIFFTIEETDSVAREKQIQRIRSLFRRQLSIPLAELNSTLLAYKAWEADNGSLSDSSELDGLPLHVGSVSEKALKMLNARAHFEEKVSKKDVDSEKLQEYMTYLKFEHSSGDPARIQILYERAIADFPISSDLWIDYTQYLDKTFKLSTVFEKSLQCVFSTFNEYLNIFLTRVDGLRRRICSSTAVEDGMDYAVIRDIFQNSGSMLEAWLAYITWEIEMGQINEARSIYKRCYSKRFPGTGSEEIIQDICHSWVCFEREYGSLEHFDIAVQKVAPRLQELQLFRLQQESKNVGLATNERESSSMKNAREKRKPTSNPDNEQSPAKHRKTTAQKLKKTNENNTDQAGHAAEASEAAERDAKKSESSSQQTDHKFSRKSMPFNDQCTAFVSNLNLQATDDDLHKFFADVGGVVAVRILKDKFTKKSRGLAYVDFSDDAHLTAALEKNKHTLFGKRLSVLKSDPQQGRKKKIDGRSIRSGQGEKDSEEASSKGRKEEQSQSQSSSSDVQLKGRNTFALPRNVKPLIGRSTQSKPQSDGVEKQEDEEHPKSNDEFRKMFTRK
ncbi:hypothetical protein OROGR_030972 [Orobanche gracilis]